MKLKAMIAFARGKAAVPLALGSAAWFFWQWMIEPEPPPEQNVTVMLGDTGNGPPRIPPDLRNLKWVIIWDWGYVEMPPPGHVLKDPANHVESP